MYKTVEQIDDRIKQLENELHCLKVKRRTMGWRNDPFRDLEVSILVTNCVIRNYKIRYHDRLPRKYTITIGDIEEEMKNVDMLLSYRNFGVTRQAMLEKAMADYKDAKG